MKKILKNIFPLLLVLAMTFGLQITAFASESSVTYQDNNFIFKPGSDYSGTDLFENFKDVMPGDTLTETIEVKNDSGRSDYVTVYLKAQIHDKADAAMLDFLSRLHLKVYDSGNLIFDGAANETDGLTDNVRLGTFHKGEGTTLQVELTVPIELGNEYANRIGKVDWVFLAEEGNYPPEPEYETRIVKKVWQDDGINRPKSVKVTLMRNGEPFETVEINEGCNWKYIWTNLASGYSWTIVEKDVPEGYQAAYNIVTDTTTITNKKIGISYEDLQVIKAWSDNRLNRPDSITVTLFSGETAVETVTLSAKNKWSHTWKNLPTNGNWSVVETSVPMGYRAMYSRHGNTIVITNVSSLLQTGQLNWPIYLLLIAAAVLMTAGIVIKQKKRKSAV